MKWLRFRVRTVPDAEDIIVSELSELGLEGAQIEDNVPLTASELEHIYTYDADKPSDSSIAEGEAYVSFYTELRDDGSIEIANTDRDFFEEGIDPSYYIGKEAVNTDNENSGQSMSLEPRKITTPEKLLSEIEEVLEEIKGWCDIGSGTVATSILDDVEWKDKWKEYFHSFRIDDVFVTPSWEENKYEPGIQHGRDDSGIKYVLKIDPGTAFGTGAHETTQLVIRALRKIIKELKVKNSNISVLDIGTGSGILSILALMFGADFCVGTDLDPFTKDAVKQNLENNNIDKESFKLVLGNLISEKDIQKEVMSLLRTRLYEKNISYEEAEAGYDIVIANILPNVLVPLTPVVPVFLKKGAYYITSGILLEKKEMMKKVIYDAGLKVIEENEQGEWCSLMAVKEK